MKPVLLIAAAVVLLIVAAGMGYYFGNESGLRTATNTRNEFFQQRFAAQGTPGATGADAAANGQRGTFAGRPAAAGTVKSVQGNAITVTEQDGTTATVTVDDKTTITKQVTGTLADVQAGWRISVVETNGVKRITLTQGN